MQDPEYTKDLMCKYRPGGLPYIVYKEEVLSWSPRISMFYDVMSDMEAEMLKAKAYPLVRQMFLKLIFIYYLSIWVLTTLSTHCIGHITTGSFMCRETSSYSQSRFCTVNFRPTASNYQLSNLRSDPDSNFDLRGVTQKCYHSATVTSLTYPLT